jgi:hypothetical protein
LLLLSGTVNWLTAVATAPATPTYVAIDITIAGNAIGAVNTAALAAASPNPMFLNTLKNLGVGALILSITFFMLFVIEC